MTHKITIFMLFLRVFNLPGNCNYSPGGEVIGKQVSVPGGSYTDISVTELQTMLANKDFSFINVHIPFEGNITNTDLSIPYDEIEQNLDKLPGAVDDKIVLYCRSDRMSIAARPWLLGYPMCGT
jgi:hypothetical protein